MLRSANLDIIKMCNENDMYKGLEDICNSAVGFYDHNRDSYPLGFYTMLCVKDGHTTEEVKEILYDNYMNITGDERDHAEEAFEFTQLEDANLIIVFESNEEDVFASDLAAALKMWRKHKK